MVDLQQASGNVAQLENMSVPTGQFTGRSLKSLDLDELHTLAKYSGRSDVMLQAKAYAKIQTGLAVLQPPAAPAVVQEPLEEPAPCTIMGRPDPTTDAPATETLKPSKKTYLKKTQFDFQWLNDHLRHYVLNHYVLVIALVIAVATEPRVGRLLGRAVATVSAASWTGFSQAAWHFTDELLGSRQEPPPTGGHALEVTLPKTQPPVGFFQLINNFLDKIMFAIQCFLTGLVTTGLVVAYKALPFLLQAWTGATAAPAVATPQ
jgi:hypothetical protein